MSEPIEFTDLTSVGFRYWCATHVFQTQYSIQIIRCTKPECCGPWRSNYIQVFPHRFLPPPVPFHRSSNGVRLADVECSFADQNAVSPYYGTLYQRIQFHGIVMRRTSSQLIPFDAYCPSLQNQLHSRICSICKQYIPLGLRLRNHYKVHQQRYALNRLPSNHPTKKEEEEMVDDNDPIDVSDLPLAPIDFSQGGVYLFSDMVEWLKSEFEDDPIVETKQKSVAATAMAMIRKDKQAAIVAAAAAAAVPTTTTATEETSVESVATISVDDALASNDPLPLSEIQIKQECVDEAISRLTMRADSYDDLSDLIDQM